MSHAIAESTLSNVRSFTFNGNTGKFTRDFSKDFSEDLPELLSPFQILIVRRQLILEDKELSNLSSESKGIGIYKSPLLPEGHTERFSLHNHKGQTYTTPSGNTEFTNTEITRIARQSTLSKNLSLNKKVVVFGIMKGNLYQITSSEGNFDEIWKFIQRSTTTNLFPYASVSSERKDFSNGKSYYALKVSQVDTAKHLPPSKDLSESVSNILSHIERSNARLPHENGKSLEVLQEFEERIRGYAKRVVTAIPEPVAELKSDVPREFIDYSIADAELDSFVPFPEDEM